MKSFEFEATRVHMRGMPTDNLNQLGKKGFRVVASAIHNNEFVLLLEREVEVKAKSAAKKAEE